MADPKEKLEEQLKTIRAEFANHLPGRIRTIQRAWETAEADWQKENLRALYRQIHSLAGSGATFGFAELGSLAREAEVYLQGLLESETPATSAQIAQMNALVDQIAQSAFEPLSSADSPVASASAPATILFEKKSHLVYLVEGDRAQTRVLEQQLFPFGYVLLVFTDASSVSQAIENDRPEAIILDASLPDGNAAGIQILGKLRTIHESPLPLIVIASRNGLQDRLDAARMGASAYLIAPVEINALIAHLDMLTAQKAPEPYRILIVEDDAEMAKHNAAILESAGMVARIVTDPMKVIGELVDFVPGLILMDLYMPTVNGLELAAVIRQEEAFISIPIVFLSAVKNPDIQLAAMKLGADDFLAKPIQADRLISSVSSRAQRYVNMRYFMTRDGLTGLLNHTATEERLENEIARTRRLKSKLAYALLDIDLFKQVNDTYGHAVGDRVLKSLARLMEQRFRKSDAIGRYGGEEFAVILPDTDGETALRILDKLRSAFGQIRHQSDHSEFSITFSAGVAAFPPHGDAVAVSKAADKALYLAKNRGRNQVVLAE